MQTCSIDPATDALHAALNDPRALSAPRGFRLPWLGPVISAAILVCVVLVADRLRVRADLHAMKLGAGFWWLFAVYCLVTPLSEWFLYHRLWSIPVSGLVALLRKYVANEMLLGYLGEADFYAWARREGQLSGAPFGVIKDVAILSALCGNLVSAATLPFGLALIEALEPQRGSLLLLGSTSLIVGIPLLALLLRRRLFSLAPDKLWFIAGVHFARIMAGMTLYALLWHAILPHVAAVWLILLTFLRQMVSRLPLVPNKEVLFAAIAVFFLGQDNQIVGWLAVLGGLTLALQAGLGLLVGLFGLASEA